MNGQWLGTRAIRTNWATRKPPAPKDGKSLDIFPLFLFSFPSWLILSLSLGHCVCVCVCTIFRTHTHASAKVVRMSLVFYFIYFVWMNLPRAPNAPGQRGSKKRRERYCPASFCVSYITSSPYFPYIFFLFRSRLFRSFFFFAGPFRVSGERRRKRPSSRRKNTCTANITLDFFFFFSLLSFFIL